ncbi:MAG: ABC transporter permease [Hungatella sp.]
MKKSKLTTLLKSLIQPALAIFLALLVGAVIILINGENPLKIYGIMLKGAFGSTYYTLTTLNRATPIIICGLGAAIAWNSRYMGIGGEGQMIWGGFTCAIIAIYAPGPAWFKLILAVTSAVIVGGLYSAFTAWLLDKFQMQLAISTLMLNYIAQFVTLHFVSNVFLDVSGDKKVMQTVMINESLRLPKIVEGYSLHIGFVIAVILVVIMWFVSNKTTFGYEAKMTGYNINFCNYGGVGSKKIMYGVLFLSGAICALAGAGEVLGVEYRYVHDTYVSGSFAWVGLNAALISGFNPIGVFFTSIILAGIQTGGSAIARSTTVPLEISSVIQGCITLFISVKFVINFAKMKRISKQA